MLGCADNLLKFFSELAEAPCKCVDSCLLICVNKEITTFLCGGDVGNSLGQLYNCVSI